VTHTPGLLEKIFGLQNLGWEIEGPFGCVYTHGSTIAPGCENMPAIPKIEKVGTANFATVPTLQNLMF
jgi:hypothetical protein